MIAIIAESIIIETSVRLSGRTIAGYLIGAVLAMSWNLFQKIANYIIFYGENIIEVYNNLIGMAQRQLNIQTDIAWLPIIALLVVFAIFGLLAGVTGIMVGRKMRKQPSSELIVPGQKPLSKTEPSLRPAFEYSIPWLIADVILLTGSFVILNTAPWFVWGVVVIAVIVIWSIRYKRALRQISRPKFWIFFVLITLITAFALSKAHSGEISLQEGILTGIQMNFRAAVIIAGFTVLGTELYNPRIRNFFQGTSFRNLPLALELSAESLPHFISSVPDFRSLVRNPVSIFYHIIRQAESRFHEIKGRSAPTPKTFIVTGPLGSGKSTFLKQLTDALRKNGHHPQGFISERKSDDSGTAGYDLVNIETGERHEFLRKSDESGPERIGRFVIVPGSIEKGAAILNSAGKGIIIIDEVGALEISGRGWASCIDGLLARPVSHLILSVRETQLEGIKSLWHLDSAMTIEIRKTWNEDALKTILDNL
jgi:nucleoside-triphosphatase THEP1